MKVEKTLRKKAKPALSPRPVIFREQFALLWRKLFTSPVHLDSAVSKAPPSVKGALAEIAKAILRRPHSLARFLRFKLTEGEPWGYTVEELADWKTASFMADRLFATWKSDPRFQRGQRGTLFDFPDMLTHEWMQDFGKEKAKQLAGTLGEEAPLSLRVNRRFPVKEVLSSLNDSGMLPERAHLSDLSPAGITIPSYAPVLQHELFEKGAFEIQDEGSQLMSYFALWPEEFRYAFADKPGVRRTMPPGAQLPSPPKSSFVAVDACAGAGGKSLALADAMAGRGQVFAYDISDKKLLSLRQRAKRAGFNNIKTAAVKENREDELTSKFAESADLVLVDSPCSGLGVLRRNPDIKWRVSEESFRKLPELQLRLLNAYSTLVKPGGRLVYGVCTFRKAETSHIVERFLGQQKTFTSLGGGYLGPHSADGFFVWAFTRNT